MCVEETLLYIFFWFLSTICRVTAKPRSQETPYDSVFRTFNDLTYPSIADLRVLVQKDFVLPAVCSVENLFISFRSLSFVCVFSPIYQTDTLNEYCVLDASSKDRRKPWCHNQISVGPTKALQRFDSGIRAFSGPSKRHPKHNTLRWSRTEASYRCLEVGQRQFSGEDSQYHAISWPEPPHIFWGRNPPHDIGRWDVHQKQPQTSPFPCEFLL